MKSGTRLLWILTLTSWTTHYSAQEKNPLPKIVTLRCSDGKIIVREKTLLSFDFFKGISETYGSLDQFLSKAQQENHTFLSSRKKLTAGIVSCELPQYGAAYFKIATSYWLLKILTQYIEREGQCTSAMEVFFGNLTFYEFQKLLTIIEHLCPKEDFYKKLVENLTLLTSQKIFKSAFLKSHSQAIGCLQKLDRLCWNPFVHLRPRTISFLKKVGHKVDENFFSPRYKERHRDDGSLSIVRTHGDNEIEILQIPSGEDFAPILAIGEQDEALLFALDLGNNIAIQSLQPFKHIACPYLPYRLQRTGAFSENGSRLLIADYSSLTFFETKTGTLVKKIHFNDVPLYALSPQGKLFALLIKDRIEIKEVDSGYLVHTYTLPPISLYPSSFKLTFLDEQNLAYSQPNDQGILELPTIESRLSFSENYLIDCIEKSSTPITLSHRTMSLFQALPESYRNQLSDAIRIVKFETAV